MKLSENHHQQKNQILIVQLENIFLDCSDSVETKLDNFPKYIREQKLRRLLALYEVFKKILPVKGSVVECGVYGGFGLMSWALMSSILEPVNLNRRIYGFDTFEGFPSVGSKDQSKISEIKRGEMSNASS